MFTEEDLLYFKKLAERRDKLGKLLNTEFTGCEKCGTMQVQLIDWDLNIYPAKWKCRHCKHEFEWEGNS